MHKTHVVETQVGIVADTCLGYERTLQITLKLRLNFHDFSLNYAQNSKELSVDENGTLKILHRLRFR